MGEIRSSAYRSWSYSFGPAYDCWFIKGSEDEPIVLRSRCSFAHKLTTDETLRSFYTEIKSFYWKHKDERGFNRLPSDLKICIKTDVNVI